jgi:hypothetical protein
MTMTLRLACLLCMVSVLSFAGSWTGALVDTNCYTTAQRNSSHGHPASGDTKRAVRSCAPSGKTMSFSVVQQVGMAFNLDSDGNEKARELVLKEGKKSPFMVHVTGDVSEDNLKVDTISIAK